MDTADIKIWMPESIPFEGNTVSQYNRIATQPFVEHMAIMPDAHVGIGAVVGSVIATKSAVIPSAVGVDIGCGMIAQRLSLKDSDLPTTLSQVRASLERVIPVGFSQYEHVPGSVTNAWSTLEPRFKGLIKAKPGKKNFAKGNEVNQLGTMGGGNHFLEISIDEVGSVWVVLHSGSRGVGNRIGSYYIEAALKDCEKAGIKVARDNGWLTENTDLFKDYIEAVEWAQDYAATSRQLMMDRVLNELRSMKFIPTFTLQGKAIACHHNYISREHHFSKDLIVTRKGAVRAAIGDLGIIPGSMGAKSYIVEGLGNPDSMNSCSHGAGRIHSRSAAKSLFSVDSLKEATDGVECRKDSGVIDEHPGSYKDIDAVMQAQQDLVKVQHTLKAVLCIKG